MPPSANIPSLIGARAREFPDHPFLVSWRDIASRSSDPPRSLSFLEFAVHVELATAALAEFGVADATAILSHNSVEYWVFACAVVCRGAPCILLNHRLPAPTLAAMAASATPFSAAVQVAALSAHAELAAPVALCGSLLLVHALGLPLPDVGGAWAAARRAVVRRAERAPLHLCGGAGASHEQSQKLLEPPPGSPDSV